MGAKDNFFQYLSMGIKSFDNFTSATSFKVILTNYWLSELKAKKAHEYFLKNLHLLRIYICIQIWICLVYSTHPCSCIASWEMQKKSMLASWSNLESRWVCRDCALYVERTYTCYEQSIRFTWVLASISNLLIPQQEGVTDSSQFFRYLWDFASQVAAVMASSVCLFLFFTFVFALWKILKTLL